MLVLPDDGKAKRSAGNCYFCLRFAVTPITQNGSSIPGRLKVHCTHPAGSCRPLGQFVGKLLHSYGDGPLSLGCSIPGTRLHVLNEQPVHLGPCIPSLRRKFGPKFLLEHP